MSAYYTRMQAGVQGILAFTTTMGSVETFATSTFLCGGRVVVFAFGFGGFVFGYCCLFVSFLLVVWGELFVRVSERTLNAICM